jgi:ureidoglycolate dehydrogenase (NAD+)
LGHFLSVWDVQRFVPLATFKERIAEMIYELHELPTASGHGKVLHPGEPEALCSKERGQHGIPLEPGLLAELQTLGGEFGIQLPVLE